MGFGAKTVRSLLKTVRFSAKMVRKSMDNGAVFVQNGAGINAQCRTHDAQF
jgi:hypothetical protein